MSEPLSRRVQLVLILVAMASSSLRSAAQPVTISVSEINHMVIHVSDLESSVKWYQRLFGLPITMRNQEKVVLRVGDNQFLTMTEASEPGIVSIGFAPRQFDLQSTHEAAKQHGAKSMRENQDGFQFLDPAGIAVQLYTQNDLNSLRLDPPKGLLPLRDYNHFTVFVPDAKRNVRFYQELFGLKIDTYQGPMPIIRVGKGNQFLAFVGGRTKAFVHHVCFAVDNFDPDRVLGLLAKYGVKPRKDKRGPAGPLESYVVMRMPNRGGAPEGTPELYLTDPDGILLQLQDVRYSGGGGYLGDRRGTPKREK